MSNLKKSYCADFFKKDVPNGDESSGKRALFERKSSEKNVLPSVYQSEDKIIARLYRRVVDDICDFHHLTDRIVDRAISKIKKNLNLAHRRDFRRFQGIDFNLPVNTCGYLRCYAIPYTGMVKKAIFDFFHATTAKCSLVRESLLANDFLSVISLGGGPGNDLVGLCSAIQDTRHTIRKLQLKVVDVCSGWSQVLGSVIAKAKTEGSGSFSNLVRAVDVTAEFACKDLTVGTVFKDQSFASSVGEADIILMVKFSSFLQEQYREPLLLNTARLMHTGATLIYIDYSHTGDLFSHIRSLEEVYTTHLEYEIDFDPVRFRCPTVKVVKAYVRIFQKVANLSRSLPNPLHSYLEQAELDRAGKVTIDDNDEEVTDGGSSTDDDDFEDESEDGDDSFHWDSDDDRCEDEDESVE